MHYSVREEWCALCHRTVPFIVETKRDLYLNCSGHYLLFIWFNALNAFFVCFVALSPKSTAMVMAGRSVHLTTLFPGKA